MAKIKENKKGFKIIEISRAELVGKFPLKIKKSMNLLYDVKK